jgi:hypothetical protein
MTKRNPRKHTTVPIKMLVVATGGELAPDTTEKHKTGSLEYLNRSSP